MYINAVIIFLIIYLIACSSSKKAMRETVINVTASDSISGLRLIEKSDCFTCHSSTHKLAGPSFYEISKKYNTTIESLSKLSKKIIQGGNGSWGSIFMTPHPGISQSDAEAMVKYILLLKK